MDKIKAVVIDLDGTLCNIDHRSHFVQSNRKNWSAFFAGVRDDVPNNWCVNLVKMYHKEGYKVIFMSGRHEDLRIDSTEWLYEKCNILVDNENYFLYMRNSKDFRKDSIIKQELYEKFVKPTYDIEIIVDDRKQVTEMWRNLGLTVLQCAFGEY